MKTILFNVPIMGEDVYPRATQWIQERNAKTIKKKSDFLSSDEVILVFGRHVLPLTILCKIFRKKVIIDHWASWYVTHTYKNRIIRKIAKYNYKLAFKLADEIFTFCDGSKIKLERIYNVKIKILYFNQDPSIFKPLKKEMFKNKFVVLYHGAFHKHHDIEKTLNAFTIAAGKSKNIVAITIGKKINNPNIHSIGWKKLEEIPKLINQCDLYVRLEKDDYIFPTCIIQAMLCGKPILTTKTFGNYLALGDNDGIIYVNKKVMAEKIANKIIELSKKNLKSAGEKARLFALNKFSYSYKN